MRKEDDPEVHEHTHANSAEGSITELLAARPDAFRHWRARYPALWAAVAATVYTLLASTAYAYDVALTWRSVSSAASYNVYVRIEQDVSVEPTGANSLTAATGYTLSFPSATLGTVTHIIRDLPLGPTAYFTITSIDPQGRESKRSNQLYITYAAVARVIDSDGDGLTDAQEDIDLDGVRDAGETDPQAEDSDGDGWSDGYERNVSGTDALDGDTDADGILDALDTCHDIDGDGLGADTIPTSTCPIDNCVQDYNPAQQDSDGDGMGEPCDPCTSLDGRRIMTSKRHLRFNRINYDPVRWNDGVSIKGDFTLPENSDFLLLAPAERGARIIITVADGSVRVDETIPAGLHPGSKGGARGWKYVNKQHAWKYVDSTGDRVNGFSKVMIKDLSKRAPRALRVTVKGRGGDYPIGDDDVPANASLVVGDAESSLIGECGESDFAASDCQFNRSRRKLTCKTK